MNKNDVLIMHPPQNRITLKTISQNLWPEPNPAVPVAIPKIVYGSQGNLSCNTIIWVAATPPIRDAIYAILKPVDRTSVGYISGAYIKIILSSEVKVGYFVKILVLCK